MRDKGARRIGTRENYQGEKRVHHGSKFLQLGAAVNFSSACVGIAFLMEKRWTFVVEFDVVQDTSTATSLNLSPAYRILSSVAERLRAGGVEV